MRYSEVKGINGENVKLSVPHNLCTEQHVVEEIYHLTSLRCHNMYA